MNNILINPYSWKARRDSLQLPFPMSEYNERLQKTQETIDKKGLEAVVICGDTGHKGNVRWLANWEPGVGNAFLFVPARGEVSLVLNNGSFAGWLITMVSPLV